MSGSILDVDHKITIANSEGLLASDRQIRSRLRVGAVASRGGENQTGSCAPGKRRGFELYELIDPKAVGVEAAEQAVTMLNAGYCPAGKMPVAIGNGFGGVIFHEACGHSLEAASVAYGQSEFAGKDVTVLPFGKKAADYFRSHNVPMLTEEYADAEDISIGDCFSVAKELSKAYLAGEFDEIYVGYTNFISVLSQAPATLRMLPLLQTPSGKSGAASSEILYEPNSEEVFAQIVPEYLGGILYGALCESRASEQAARRTAMDSATSNAEDMIADLSLKFNRARQAAITQEITEIVAGS